MSKWYAEGEEAARYEFQKGERMPTLEELLANVKESLGLTGSDATAFALGWLAAARRQLASSKNP